VLVVVGECRFKVTFDVTLVHIWYFTSPYRLQFRLWRNRSL